jgi:DNA polymerase-1
MENQNDRHFIIIDGYGFVFRAYHALPPLNSPDGIAVGAVFGFLSMLMKLFSEVKATHAAVIFDSGRKSFRNDLFPAYKAHRPPAPDDLRVQFPIVREAAEALNLVAIEHERYEADDIIATLADMALKADEKVTIVSSDKDLMQLIDGKITMLDPMKSKIITSFEVQEKFGVMPNKLLDVLSLMGDASDNIPGVPGIGPKTAAELINNFGSLDELLSRFHEIKQDKRRQVIGDNIEAAKLSRQLITLVNNVPINLLLEDLKVKPADSEKFFKFIEKYGFKRLRPRAEQFFSVKAPVNIKKSNSAPKINEQVITSLSQLNLIIDQAKRSGKLAIELNKNSFSVTANEDDVYKYDLSNKPKLQQISMLESADTNDSHITLSNIINCLKPAFDDLSILKIGHNLKTFMKQANIDNLEPQDDIMLLSYIANNGLNNHNLETLVEKHFADIDKAPVNSNYILQLHSLLKQQLYENKLVSLYEKCERPLIKILYKMEAKGVKIDCLKLNNLSQDFASRLKILEQDIYNQAGCQFNIGSPKQLGGILFSNLGLSSKKISKSGNLSTNADILEQLAEQGHKIAEDVLVWRQLSKLKNTYSDALPLQVNPKTGRVHSNFSMAATSTGRLSSSDPNLQNIPIRSEEGNKIREAFIAEENYKLISVDYSQIELRLLAHMANIEVLKSAFKHNKDIHAITASQIFRVSTDQVDANMRRKAKAINFGIIYGISGFGLAKQLDISRAEATEYIKAYFKEYPGIENYMEVTKEFARKHGYVETLMGRKCHFPSINDKNGMLRSLTERAVINAPIQGTAADIIKKAMVKLDKILEKNSFKTKMILQVHDELLFEAPKEEIEQIINIIKQIMENVIELTVPLSVDIKYGNSWAEIH